METSVIGYPRIGTLRELKFAIEKYFNNIISKEELQSIVLKLKKIHWKTQQNNGIDFISSNDFSFYDNLLDTACLLNIIPKRYKALKLDTLDEYFAMARGYQGKNGDVKALAMKKWFNTNYHYMVPEIEEETEIRLTGTKPFEEYLELGYQLVCSGINFSLQITDIFNDRPAFNMTFGITGSDYIKITVFFYKRN